MRSDLKYLISVQFSLISKGSVCAEFLCSFLKFFLIWCASKEMGLYRQPLSSHLYNIFSLIILVVTFEFCKKMELYEQWYQLIKSFEQHLRSYSVFSNSKIVLKKSNFRLCKFTPVNRRTCKHADHGCSLFVLN